MRSEIAPLESIQPAGVLALVSLVVPWWSQGKEMPLPRGCVRQRQPILMAGMSTSDKHGSNVRYGGRSGSCKDGADAVGVATIDGVAVVKAADVEDSGGVVPKTEENTRFGGADNEAREFARDGVHVGGS